MATLDQIDKSRIPQHIAIIMDGNGRWAKERGLERTEGHFEGVEALHRVMLGIKKVGVKYVTVYSFSTENWNRPQEEVDTLMHLIALGLKRETPFMLENGVRLRMIGDISRMPAEPLRITNECVEATKDGKVCTLLVAFNYGSRDEIVRAARRLAEEVKQGDMTPDDINEESFGQRLYTADVPDPDLLIRTGGEQRISNYLLWQIAYSELYFTPVFWPDFGEEQIFDAIVDFQSRERRFGKTSAQVEAEEKEK